MNNETPELPKKNFDAEKIVNESKEIVKEDAKTFKKFFKDAKDYLTTRNTKELGMLLVRVIIIVAILVLFRFPFDLITDLGLSLLNVFNIVITYEILKIWNFICDASYSIIALVVFYKLITTRYDNLLKKKINKD